MNPVLLRWRRWRLERRLLRLNSGRFRRCGECGRVVGLACDRLWWFPETDGFVHKECR